MGDATNQSDVRLDTGAVGVLGTVLIWYHSVSFHHCRGATFGDAASFATALTINSNNLSDVLGYLEANANTNGVIAFEYDSNSNGTADATMVFQARITH